MKTYKMFLRPHSLWGDDRGGTVCITDCVNKRILDFDYADPRCTYGILQLARGRFKELIPKND